VEQQDLDFCEAVCEFDCDITAQQHTGLAIANTMKIAMRFLKNTKQTIKVKSSVSRSII